MYRWLSELDRALGPAPRDPGDYPRPTRLGWPKHEWPLMRAVDDFDGIVQRGVLAVGRLVMASTEAFEPSANDAPLTVIYTFDRTLWRQPSVCDDIADRLFDFYRKPDAVPAHPSERHVYEQMRRDTERPIHERVPASLSDGFVVYWCRLMLFRAHVPGHALGSNYFPLLVDLDGPKPPLAVMVPHSYWPNTFVRQWELMG